MAEVSAAAVKALRERTNLPLMKCKEALTKTAGDVDKALKMLGKFVETRGERQRIFSRPADAAVEGSGDGKVEANAAMPAREYLSQGEQ